MLETHLIKFLCSDKTIKYTAIEIAEFAKDSRGIEPGGVLPRLKNPTDDDDE